MVNSFVLNATQSEDTCNCGRFLFFVIHKMHLPKGNKLRARIVAGGGLHYADLKEWVNWRL